MTIPEEIKKITNKIARSFVHPDDHTPYGEQTYRQVEAVITQLCKDYCIVPKSKAHELHQIVTDNMDSLGHGLIDGLSDWVEINLGSLFEEEK